MGMCGKRAACRWYHPRGAASGVASGVEVCSTTPLEDYEPSIAHLLPNEGADASAYVIRLSTASAIMGTKGSGQLSFIRHIH